ncbi:ABC transporter permease [Bacillaceae bacterium IKA-2]|nr:ABC transporter permease [Bacillaceae bacterium IKA-2]
MITIAARNLKLFFRDKTTVFFSLLGVIIIIGLYVLFLGDMLISGMDEIENARFLLDSWIMAGLLAVTSITTTMGAFGIMVDDRANKIIKDFSSSPIKNRNLAGGYIVSAFVIGVIISLIALVFAEVYIVSNGGQFLSFLALMKVLGLILLSVLSSSSMVFFMVSFFKSQNAFATASTVIGTLIGFLTGIYIPIGSLPDTVQLAIKIFPVSHAGSLFRQVMMAEPMEVAFKDAPTESIENFNQSMGVVFNFGGYTTTMLTSVVILLATTALFYGLAILNISRKRK